MIKIKFCFKKKTYKEQLNSFINLLYLLGSIGWILYLISIIKHIFF